MIWLYISLYRFKFVTYLCRKKKFTEKFLDKCKLYFLFQNKYFFRDKFSYELSHIVAMFVDLVAQCILTNTRAKEKKRRKYKHYTIHLSAKIQMKIRSAV